MQAGVPALLVKARGDAEVSTLHRAKKKHPRRQAVWTRAAHARHRCSDLRPQSVFPYDFLGNSYLAVYVPGEDMKGVEKRDSFFLTASAHKN